MRFKERIISKISFWRRNSKSWLKENKILFDVFSAIVLSGMALILSYNSNLIAKKQTDLMDLQTKIQNQQILPSFIITTSLQYDNDTAKYNNEEINIYNQGNYANHLKSEYATLIEVNYFNGKKSDKMYIPLAGYYVATRHNSSGSKDIPALRIVGARNNNTSFHDLEKKYREDIVSKYNINGDFHSSALATSSIGLVRYVKLEYQTLLGDNRIVYYRVNPINGGELISNDYGNEMFGIYNDYENSIYRNDLWELSPEVLRDEIIKHLDEDKNN